MLCSTITLLSTIMNTQFNTPLVKLIVLRAHLPEQMGIVVNALCKNYPVTMYADELTEDVAKYSKSPLVQTRIGQPMNCTLIDDGSVIVRA